MALAAKLVGWAKPAAGDVGLCSEADRARTLAQDSDGECPDAAVVVGAPADGYRGGGGSGGGGARGFDVVVSALELSERLDGRYGLVLPLAVRLW